ncbi:MAG: hypothetical protein ACK5SX_06065 [Sandaracinobacter sp.]
MTKPAIIPGGDLKLRRAMFVLELVDPVTNRPVGASFEARAKGLRPPGLTQAGQLVWIDVDPPAQRDVAISARALAGDYAPWDTVQTVAKRIKDQPPTLIRHNLQPTGAYRPPDGRIAAAGMLIDDKTVRAPIAGATVLLVLDSDTLGAEMRSSLAAVTDARGGFVAAGVGFADRVPRPASRPAPDSAVKGRVEVTWQGNTRSRPVTLRAAQTNYLADPLIWGEPNL